MGYILFIFGLYVLTKLKLNKRYNILLLLISFLIIITHHFTAYMFVSFLLLFWVIDKVSKKKYFENLNLLTIIIIVLALIMFSLSNNSIPIYKNYIKSGTSSIQSQYQDIQPELENVPFTMPTDYNQKITNTQDIKELSQNSFYTKLKQFNIFLIDRIKISVFYQEITWNRFISFFGQGLLIMLGVIGVFYSFFNKRNFTFTALWFIGISLTILFLFIIPWDSPLLSRASDIRYRIENFSYLLIIPITLVGYTKIKNLSLKSSFGKYLIKYSIFIIISLILLSVVTFLTPKYYTSTKPDNAGSVIEAPIEWYQSALWAENNIDKDSKIIGSRRIRYYTTIAEFDANYNLPPEHITKTSNDKAYLAISRDNLILNDRNFGQIRSYTFNEIKKSTDLVYDNGQVWIFKKSLING